MDDQKHIATLDAGECLSHAQLLAYHAGGLSPAESHHVERHLLDCELCSEALEGLEGVEPAQVEAAVADLQGRAWARVAEIEKRRRRGAWIWITSSAATVLLVVGLYFFSGGNEATVNSNTAFKKAFDSEPVPVPETAMLDSMVVLAESSAPDEVEFRNQNGSDFKVGMGLEKTVFQSPIVNGTLVPDLDEANEVAKIENKNLEEVTDDYKLAQDQFTLFNAKPAERKSNETSKSKVMFDFMKEDDRIAAREEKKDGYFADRETEDVLDDAPTDMAGDEMSVVEMDAEIKGEKTVADNRLAITGGMTPAADSVVVTGVLANDATVSQYTTLGSTTTINTSPSSTFSWTPLSVAPAQDIVTIQSADKNRNVKSKTSAAPATNNRSADNGFFAAGNISPGVETQEGLRDSAKVSQLALAKSTHQQGNYRDALTQFEQIAKDDPANYEAKLYAGIDYLALGNPARALLCFNEVIALGNEVLKEDATWYKALTYLQVNDKAQATPLLQKLAAKPGRYQAKAVEALKSL
jgi:tetratricopeptide (TPR) repeat protein